MVNQKAIMSASDFGGSTFDVRYWMFDVSVELNIEHSTSNVQHRTKKRTPARPRARSGSCLLFDAWRGNRVWFYRRIPPSATGRGLRTEAARVWWKFLRFSLAAGLGVRR